jgi:hypothetical protein
MKKLAVLVLFVFILSACGTTELKVGQIIDSSAKVTRNTYEHPIDPPAGYSYAAYVRLNGEETILYSKDPVKCKLGQDIKFSGRVRAAKAAPEGSDKQVEELHIVLNGFECTGTPYEPETTGINVNDIENIFKDRVVYGTGLDERDPQPYKENCEARGGTFNACGSPCDPEADSCIEVCAYTCDF